MGRRRTGCPPAYLLHKSSGQAYVTVGGKSIYLGRHGSRESRRRYKEVVTDWERQHRAEPLEVRV